MKNNLRIVYVDDGGHVVLSKEQQEQQLLEYLRAKEEGREPEDIRSCNDAEYVMKALILFDGI